MANPGITCEKCGKPVRQDGSRWVHADGITYRHQVRPLSRTVMLRASWYWSGGEDRLMQHMGPLADTGDDRPPTDEEMQKMTFALKQAWAKCIRARKAGRR